MRFLSLSQKAKVKLVILREHGYLIAILSMSLILRMLCLKTAIYPDEGEAGYTGMLWIRGYLPYAYRPVMKPPLLYLFYLIPNVFFGNSIIPIRIINNILFLVSTLALYLIAQDWYGKRVGLFSILFYGIFMNVPTFEGQLALPISISLSFFIFAIYFCNKYLRNGKKISLSISGILMSIALLIHQEQASGIILPILMILKKVSFGKNFETKLGYIKSFMIDMFIFSIGIFLPIFVTVSYFWSYGALNNLIDCVVVRLFTVYVPHLILGSDISLKTQILTLVGGLALVLFSIFGMLICIRRRNRNDRYLMCWVLLFLMLFILKNRYFGHYYLAMLPPASILSGIKLGSALKGAKLETVRDFFRWYKEYAATIFIIVVLILSFIPSIPFQIFQSSYYRYDQQVELANYLRSHTSKDGQMLAHGWIPTAYWLSGIEAPSVYLATFRNVSIPEDEYQRILNGVRKGDFEYIVFGYIPPEDPIKQVTLIKYFYVKNIGDIMIYSKYNLKGEFVNYSFIENFPYASKAYTFPNGTIGNIEQDFEDEPILTPVTLRASIDDDSRNVILQNPLGLSNMQSLIAYNVTVPSNSRLSFGIALAPEVWNEEGDGVLFKIIMYDDQGGHEIFSRYINPNENAEERKWLDSEIKLDQYANKNVAIYFVTTPGPNNNNRFDWAYWGDPKILQARQLDK